MGQDFGLNITVFPIAITGPHYYTPVLAGLLKRHLNGNMNIWAYPNKKSRSFQNGLV